MKYTIITFGFALLNYAIITLPVIGVPIMYGYSMVMAIGFGIPAWLIYSLVFILVKSLNINTQLKWLLLVLAVPLGVAFAYTLIEVFGVWKNVWRAGWLMLFPLAAIASGWISLYKKRSVIEEHLNPNSQEYLIY
jgi:hypothetical protein